MVVALLEREEIERGKGIEMKMPREEEEMRSDDDRWDPRGSHHFLYYFMCATYMWVTRVLLFFRI